MEEFEGLFLNTSLFKDLAKQIASNNFGQTHIVISPDDFSCNCFATILGKTLICQNSNYCKKCEDCIKLGKNTHPDLKIFNIEKGFAVANAMEILDDVYKSAYSYKKVYIISNIDLATVSAQNKLLKILEEPPKNVFFIMTATNISCVLQTILSRAIKINLSPFDFATLEKEFKNQNMQITQNSYEFGQGYLGKIIAFDSDKNFQRIYNHTFEILKNVKKSGDIVLFGEDIKREDMSTFIESLQFFLSDILYLKTDNDNLVKTSFKEDLKIISNEFSLTAISVIADKIIEAKSHLDANVNYAIIKDKLLLGILEAKYMYKD